MVGLFRRLFVPNPLYFYFSSMIIFVSDIKMNFIIKDYFLLTISNLYELFFKAWKGCCVWNWLLGWCVCVEGCWILSCHLHVLYCCYCLSTMLAYKYFLFNYIYRHIYIYIMSKSDLIDWQSVVTDLCHYHFHSPVFICFKLLHFFFLLETIKQHILLNIAYF